MRLSALRDGRPLFIPQKDSWYSLSRPQGHSAAGRIRSIEEFSDLIGNRTRDLTACSSDANSVFTWPTAREYFFPLSSGMCCIAYTWLLKMEAVHSSDASVNLYRTTRCHIPGSLRLFCCWFRSKLFSVWQCISQIDSAQGMIAYLHVNTNAGAVDVTWRCLSAVGAACLF
jgi:hypothetical protein